MRLTRRVLLGSACAAAFAGPALAAEPRFAEAFPLSAVRLTPSIYLDALNANRAYLFSLEPDRLLHNFRRGAGLEPKGALYGGWEARGIAGHTLGHYLSALALLHAQTGDEEAKRRVAYIAGELSACQSAHGDGYVGGTTVERAGVILDGKVVYEEIKRGDVRAGPFDVNGGWVPLYTMHKVHQGLLDAHLHCDDAVALDVAQDLSDYLCGVLGALDDAQMQDLLAAEHGGLNETFAEMFARTGEQRYLDMATRLRHRAVLDPLAAEEDRLAGLHANTQIPKVVGLARLHELTGDEGHARAARFFWSAVTRDHSFAIGGNSEREHFAAPGVTAGIVSDRTCEACNSYNMLRLTRHLWSWRQDGAYFDYFERTHLNHIMAHQHPETGMFVYFMPMTEGGRRQYSTPTETFWCCVGSGLESHAKHGESVYARRGDTLFVNLFIPSTLDWAEEGARFALETNYPFAETVTLRVTQAARTRMSVAMRLPGWCAAPALTLNGRAARFERRDGYAIMTRRWRAGDTVTLTLPMEARAIAAPDDAKTFALVSGPLVLAADLGPAERQIETPLPALTMAPTLMREETHVYRIAEARPAALTLRPFFPQYERRTSPYLRVLSDAEWAEREAAFAREKAEAAALDARTIDQLRLGDVRSEAAHAYRANQAELISYERVSGRQAWWGEGRYLEFELGVERGSIALSALYWGEETNKDFEIKIDGVAIARERRVEASVRAFVRRDYPIPRALTRGKARIVVRFETRGSDAPVYGVRTLRA